MKLRIVGLLILTALAGEALAQATERPIPKDWFLLDPQTDSVQGLSVEKAYRSLLAGRPAREVIVAIIDSGIDFDHEDLKDVIWNNPHEIPGNGIDDDKNGYADDVHGWNFIGGKNGNVDADTYELTREYKRLSLKFGQMEEKNVPRKLRAEYATFQKIKDKYLKLREVNEQQYKVYSHLYRNMKQSVDTLRALLKTTRLTREAVENFDTPDPNLLFAKGFLMQLFHNAGDDADIDEYLKAAKDGADNFDIIVNYGYNPDFDSRKIIGDDYANVNERHYGNADVKGPDPSHGTHVAGIIGANRTNAIGIKGIADHVKLMVVRAVPNGDERDKDIANAIIYAVDNGAHIINMSFGKDFSPEKAAVDKAVKYAEQHGVLLVHAAGNESDNTDVKKKYPSRYYLNGKEAKNWIEVGASGWGADGTLAADFSNFGSKTVSFFAPGVDIFSTAPGNAYSSESGTSFSSPATAGVAAMLMAYFPELTAVQVRQILVSSVRRFDHLKVKEPGSQKEVNFSELSTSGGLLNAYEAVRLALTAGDQKLIKK